MNPPWSNLLFGRDRCTQLRRAVYVKGLALAHLLALGSLWPQLPGLVGEQGILPFPDWLHAVRDHYGAEATALAPTLLWAWPTQAGLHTLCLAGVVMALALLLGVSFEGPLLLGLWAVYLSLAVVGQAFLNFQWDALLIEATFAALLVARWRPGRPEPPPWAWAVQHLLVFRLMFFGGLVKLTSGDPTWRDGTALTYHYFTQPLPNPVSWFAHHLPVAFHQVSVAGTLLIELVLPFAIVLGRRGRTAAFAGFSVLLGLLSLTGNYGMFQVLSWVCCLTLLTDEQLARVLPSSLRHTPTRNGGLRFARAAARGIWLAPVAALLVLLAALRVPGYFDRPLPQWGNAVIEAAAPFRTVNRYGLFARMTTERPEVVLEGSLDGQTWRPYVLPAKPGDPAVRPVQVAPHMPRLDWQLWFAALGTCDRNPWVLLLMERLVEGSPDVLGLFAQDPFPDAPPKVVRAVRWSYRFADPGHADWWVREPLGLYCPTTEGR